MSSRIALFFLLLALACQTMAVDFLPHDEVDALNQITRTMGAVGWNFSANSCGETVQPNQQIDPERKINCSCQFQNNTCHVISLVIKRYSLSGQLPVELIQLPYLESIDFSYNVLNGTIPPEWASLNLKFISLTGNRLSGNVPSYLENFTALTYLSLELNQFSGTVPLELGKLVNLETLILSSNKLTGNLPAELGQLKNLTDFRINDNNFNGSIPDFIQNWKQLKRLEMQASGLEGPIPSSISVLEKLTDLRIGDIINARNQTFPYVGNMTGLSRLVLSSCNITGEIPSYIWRMRVRILNLSFNKLHGELPSPIRIPNGLEFLFLTGNSLSGNIPIFREGTNVDLSYNNFTRRSTDDPACQQQRILNLNLYRSSSMGSDIGGACANEYVCKREWHSLYINCGGKTMVLNGKTYEGDSDANGGSATFYATNLDWGLSSTGDFMDDNNFQNKFFIVESKSQSLDELHRTIRISPLSLAYYRNCLINGIYTISLHFAEIQFTNGDIYTSLGRRVFDIYIQDELVEKDFDVEVEANGADKPIRTMYNATVTNKKLEIRLVWVGKGTTRIPVTGVYGPIISAVSVDPTFEVPSEGKTKVAPIVAGILSSFLVILVLGIVGWKCCFKVKNGRGRDFEGLEIQTVSFTLRQIKAATKNFDPENKIGEGGFGPVYKRVDKRTPAIGGRFRQSFPTPDSQHQGVMCSTSKGLLGDGTVVAVKQLSSKSSQGNREFLNEIGMVSLMQHPNLVKLFGCCIEGDQLLLVYEFMENNSLAQALYGPEHLQLKLDWRTRQKICVGIARGLAFLHEESRLKIVHRDIKATNVLLDKNLAPKISDFGLAKLDTEENTHISTRIAGTIGYMAPEYALWGYLTHKADVYSFGIVALEIITGKQNMNHGPQDKFACLLDWACNLQKDGNLLELVDEKLGSEFNEEEAERMVKVAILCTNGSPSLRPTMTEVVLMLEGTMEVPEIIPETSNYIEDVRFKALREQLKHVKGGNSRTNQPFRSEKDLYEIDEEAYISSMKAKNGNYRAVESQVSTSSSMPATSSTTVPDLSDFNLHSRW